MLPKQTDPAQKHGVRRSIHSGTSPLLDETRLTASIIGMQPESSLRQMVGHARYQPYLDAVDADAALAVDLYLWGSELAGAWHSHLSFIEVAVRNSIDCQLKAWNATQRRKETTLTPEWTGKDNTGATLYRLIGKGIDKAREQAELDAKRRDPVHPRHAAAPTHDDIVAQLTFGTWARLLRLPNKGSPTPQQKELWQQSLKHAFPHASQDNTGLHEVGSHLEALRSLRNRVAHHDNLLQVNTLARLNSSLALLASIDRGYPDLAMARNSLRRLTREDPRRIRHKHPRKDLAW